MQDDELRNGTRVYRVEGRDSRRGVSTRAVGATENWGPASGITVFLIVSRFETDHALTYLFCEGSPPTARIQAFVDSRPDRFRGSNAVIELAERYPTLAQAKQRALGLRSWLGNVNIVFPPVCLG